MQSPKLVHSLSHLVTLIKLLFNPSNSKLKYFNISHKNLSVKLCGKEVLLVSHETYQGNFIGSDIVDRAITQSVCAFNQGVTI